MQVVTAGRYHQKIWTKQRQGKRLVGGILAIKIYEAQPRLDGVLVWRLVRIEPETFTVQSTADEAAQKYATQNNLPFLPSVKQGARLPQVIT